MDGWSCRSGSGVIGECVESCDECVESDEHDTDSEGEEPGSERARVFTGRWSDSAPKEATLCAKTDLQSSANTLIGQSFPKL